MRRLAFIAALLTTAAYAESLPKSGTVKHAAYTVCRQSVAVDLGEIGSDTASECTGIVKAAEGGKAFDNLSLRCLEGSVARKSGYKFTGSCVETDGEGDKLYLVYEGPEDGPLQVLGGTGKYKGIKGAGRWRVTDAPGNTDKLFAFTLDYGFDWSFE